MTESSTTFREALSRFASGVIVVTARAPDGPFGFTASAFSSVSLEPPLVLVCVGKKASAYAGIVAAPFFGISVLQAEQGWIAEQFARQGIDRFQGVPLRVAARAPLVEGAIAQLECGHHGAHDAGDHTILVGTVLQSWTASGAPLVHFGRAFGGFAAEHPAHNGAGAPKGGRV